MSLYQKELRAAITAVIRASRLTQTIFHSLQQGNTSSASTVTKLDKSPVTIADYGSQAVVNAVLRSAFPHDPIVGEEDADELRQNSQLREKVYKLVSDTLNDIPDSELSKEGGKIEGDEDMLSLIDRGNSEGGSFGRTCIQIG